MSHGGSSSVFYCFGWAEAIGPKCSSNGIIESPGELILGLSGNIIPKMARMDYFGEKNHFPWSSNVIKRSKSGTIQSRGYWLIMISDWTCVKKTTTFVGINYNKIKIFIWFCIACCRCTLYLPILILTNHINYYSCSLSCRLFIGIQSLKLKFQNFRERLKQVKQVSLYCVSFLGGSSFPIPCAQSKY